MPFFKRNIPNFFSIFRVISIPFIALLALGGQKNGYIICALLFLLASLTDYIDGYLARRMGVVSKLGANLDLAADKLLVISCLIILSILFRDVFIYLPTFIISLREIYITRVRIISEQNPELRVIEVNLSGKIKTALQMVAIFTLFISFHPSSYSLLLENLGKIILWIALVQTIISLANYLSERRR
ncbi:MAG: CDP-diacylglycerol--glycerol-3-phosphate 3-phosphatidyltransferase [Gammaproteobacteria bacterium]|nr:MAG: CDP-diacylglycerol--glycerol-3-phosphate 3-phosphatidyltransferase [Gammaproteobacteria bacterium]